MGRKLTQKEVLERFKEVHGDRYDYSLVEYIGQGKKVIIVCRVHGDFTQNSYHHWSGKGCPKCGIISIKEKQKFTYEEVLDRFKKVHGDRYDYSLVDYVNRGTKIIIRCKKDGHVDFQQTPGMHWSGQGCPECGILKVSNIRRKTKEKFIEEAKLVHGDEYDYSLVDYKGDKINVIIICSVHGNFQQFPNNHLVGKGCQKCGRIKATTKQTKSTEDFIKQAKVVFPDGKYDYSKVEYKGSHEKVIIVCSLHGDFEQLPSSHLSGRGCAKCGTIAQIEKLKMSIDEFVERSNLVHNNFFGYEKIENYNYANDVLISCPLHGDFKQNPNSHLSGSGCPTCGILARAEKKTKSTEQFIKEAILIHKDTYKYENVDYKSATENVSITCSIHGEFLQLPSTHLQGSGCNACGFLAGAEKQTKSREQFIEEANLVHKGIYKYDKVDYKGDKNKVSITCSIHGDFLQTPGSHLLGNGCPSCANLRTAEKLTKSQEQFIEEANLKHGGIYKYDNVDYKNDRLKVSITCKIHGEFLQAAGTHLSGAGCPRCFNKREGRLAIILNEIGVVHRNFRIKNRLFDFYLPDYNLIIERDGEQHYYDSFKRFVGRKVNFEENHQIDIEKTKLAKSKGHKICRIPYWLSEEDEKKEIQNILNGQPTYPDVPDLEQSKTKPLPN